MGKKIKLVPKVHIDLGLVRDCTGTFFPQKRGGRWWPQSVTWPRRALHERAGPPVNFLSRTKVRRGNVLFELYLQEVEFA